MKRIKQGHTRWRLDVICGHGGHADLVYVYQCIVERITWCAVHYFDGREHRITSHWGWMQMSPTYRKALRAAWRKWGTYRTEAEADMAIAALERKYRWLEFRRPS